LEKLKGGEGKDTQLFFNFSATGVWRGKSRATNAKNQLSIAGKVGFGGEMREAPKKDEEEEGDQRRSSGTLED